MLLIWNTPPTHDLWVETGSYGLHCNTDNHQPWIHDPEMEPPPRAEDTDPKVQAIDDTDKHLPF